MAAGTVGTAKKTPEERFLETLRKTGNVSEALRLSGLARTSTYRRRDEDADFAREWDEALEAAIDAMELRARERAMRESDTLMIFLLKANRPEKYLDRKDITSGGKPVKALIGIDTDDV